MLASQTGSSKGPVWMQTEDKLADTNIYALNMIRFMKAWEEKFKAAVCISKYPGGYVICLKCINKKESRKEMKKRRDARKQR